MTVYAIAQSRITDPEQFRKYLARSGATLAAHQVELLAIDEHTVLVEREPDYPRTVILKCESAEHFRRWYDSPEYQAARREREQASIGRFVLVQGL